MPSVILHKMKTVWVDEDVWESPDGKVKIWNIKLEDGEGERDLYATMSKAIAEIGWSGDIELYTNQKGKEYVRQAPKEEFKDFKSGKKSEDNKFLKDTSDLPYRVWKDMLPYMDSQALVKDPNYNRQLNEYVMSQSDELLKMIEGVREDKPVKQDSLLDGVADLEDL